MLRPQAAIMSAFARLDAQRSGFNLVSLTVLRPEAMALAGMGEEGFLTALNHLRRAGILSLSGAEGRHGISEADKAAALYEGGSMLLYVSRRPG